MAPLRPPRGGRLRLRSEAFSFDPPGYGTTIALGGDAWYGQMTEADRRDVFAGRLIADLTVDSSASVFNARNVAWSEAGTSALLELLGRGPAVDRDEQGAALLLRRTMLLPGHTRRDATFRELGDEIWAAYLQGTFLEYDRRLRAHLGTSYLDVASCGPAAASCSDVTIPDSTVRALAEDRDFMGALVGLNVWMKWLALELVPAESATNAQLLVELREGQQSW